MHIFGSRDFFLTVIKKQFTGAALLLFSIIHIIVILELSILGVSMGIILLILSIFLLIELIAYILVYTPKQINKYIISIISVPESDDPSLIFETTNYNQKSFSNNRNVLVTSDVHKLIVSHNNWISSNKNNQKFCNITEDIIKNFMVQKIAEEIRESYLIFGMFNSKANKMIETDLKENILKNLWVTGSFRSKFYNENFEDIPKIETIHTDDKTKNIVGTEAESDNEPFILYLKKQLMNIDIKGFLGKIEKFLTNIDFILTLDRIEKKIRATINNKNEIMAFIFSLVFFLYLISLYFMQGQLKTYLFSINITILFIFLFAYSNYKLNIKEIFSSFLSKSEYFVIFLSIIAMILSYIHFFNASFELPWQWDIYALFLTMYTLNLPKLFSIQNDEKLNICFCIAITIIIGLEINLFQHLIDELFKNKLISWYSIEQAYLGYIMEILILFLIFMIGWILTSSLPYILAGKKEVSNKELNYKLSRNIYLLIFSSIFIGSYVLYPTLCILILFNKTLIKKNPINALSDTEENFYIRSQYSERINGDILVLSVILVLNSIIFRINIANDQSVVLLQLASIIALFLLSFYYITIIYISKHIKASSLLTANHIGSALFVLICYYWYSTHDSFPIIQYLNNFHFTIGSYGYPGLNEQIVPELDGVMLDMLVGIKYIIKYILLLQIVTFIPTIISDSFKFNFFKYNEVYKKQKFFKLFIIINIIYVFAVIIPFLELGDLNNSFGLETISTGKLYLLIIFFIVSFHRIHGIVELHRELENFKFNPI